MDWYSAILLILLGWCLAKIKKMFDCLEGIRGWFEHDSTGRDDNIQQENEDI